MRADRKQRLSEMKAICQPKEKMSGAAAIDRLVYRRIGFLFTRLFLKTRVTPNQITWAWGALMVVSSLLFLFGDPWLNLIGAGGWVLAFSLDASDGEVARYRGTSSKRGYFLDQMNHSVTWPLMFFCLGLGLYYVTGDVINIAIGFVAGTFKLLFWATPKIHLFIHLNGNPNANDVDVQSVLLGAAVIKDKKRSVKLKDWNPLISLNMHLLVFIMVIIDLALHLMSITFELLWMTSFLSIFVLLCAGGYALMFVIRFVVLYRRLD